MSASAIIAIVGIAVSLVVTVVGGLLGLLIKSNERRLSVVEKNAEELERNAEERSARDAQRVETLTTRLHEVEVEQAKLQSLHELREDVRRVQRTLDQVLQELATMRGQLRPPWSSKPSGGYAINPSDPPKRR